jgi:hypothetical protein
MGRRSDSQVAETVLDHGEKGASDDLESDEKGRTYVTSYEHDAVLRRFQTLVHDPTVLRPDTLSVAGDGYLSVIAHQVHRRAR